MLGICAGLQLQALFAGGSVRHAAAPVAAGYRPIEVIGGAELPEVFNVLARSEECAI